MNKIKAAEERYPDSDGNDLKSALKDNFNLMKRHAFIAGWDARDALSTQSPKWVKASERLWDYGKKVIVRYGNEVHYTQYHNITYCVPIESIEWLDESPSSTHPLQEKIDGLRRSLKAIEQSLGNDYAIEDIIKQALETYK